MGFIIRSLNLLFWGIAGSLIVVSVIFLTRTLWLPPVIAETFASSPQTFQAGIEALNTARMTRDVQKFSSLRPEDKLAALRPFGLKTALQPENTLVEFSDYNCGFCRSAEGFLGSLKASSPHRIVVRELPVLGESSELAARYALASVEQGKYDEARAALYKIHNMDVNTIEESLKDAGIDILRVRTQLNDPKISAEISKNRELASALGIKGTPAFIANGKLINGFDAKKIRDSLN